MKERILFGLMFLIISCSPEPNDLDLNPEKELTTLNLIIEDKCNESADYFFDEAGILKVSNSRTTLYVEVVPINGYSLDKFRLHIADTPEAFPTVGQGNLPPGQMDYQLNDPPSTGTTFQLELDNLPECFFLASNSIFIKDNTVVDAWAGTKTDSKGNWSSLSYCKASCEIPCKGRAGEDSTKNYLNLADLKKPSGEFWNVTDIRNYIFSLLDPDIPKDGSFNPELGKVRKELWEHVVQNGGRLYEPYSLETTYTVEFDDKCEDDVVIGAVIYP